MNLEEQINQLDLSTYPISEIETIIDEIYKLALLSTTIPAGSTFQRCSHMLEGEKDNLISRLSYNPCPEKYGRANVPLVPMIYGCYDKPNEYKIKKEMCACSFEARAQRYSSVIYSKWLVNQPLQVGCIVHPSIYPNSKNDLLEEIKQNYAFQVIRNNEFELDYIWGQVCAMFSKEILDDNDYEYLFTALLTKKLIEVSHYDGILFPPVQTAGELCMNLALTKDAIDNKVSFESAQKSKVSYENNVYIITPLQLGESQDGETIVWSDVKR